MSSIKVINARITLTRGAALLCALFSLCWTSSAWAAGTLTPAGSPQQPIQIRDHSLEVHILGGFAKTDVNQTFFNPNAQDLEAVYAFPVPKSASLSEFIIYSGEEELHGEVLPKAKANQIYEDEKNKGNDAGVANKKEFETYEFRVSRVRAQSETRIRFIYYQPLVIDTGVGRYVYPLEDGGTDELAKSFWVPNTKVENQFSAHFDVRLEYPIADIRLPGFENAAAINRIGDGEVKIDLQTANASLDKDIVLYYRLADNLPGRIELLPYRPDKNKPGTFMLIATPGIDLKALSSGADYVFILDSSGSMAGKIQTLARGVKQTLGQMKPEDRFRIVAFNSRAWEVAGDWQNASTENVQRAIAAVEQLAPNESTNLYEGLELGLKKLDNDRVTSVILVTDGVTNTGILDPKEFASLMKQYDVRVFGFLMGNNSNWPLMEVVTKSSGGFYSAVSNADDIVGQIMLAKSKILSESLHDASLSVRGVKVTDVTDEFIGKVYRGQQLVVFGRYDEAGPATVRLKAKLSGADTEYQTTFNFPETDTTYPEIERLWAMNQIETIQYKTNIGEASPQEGKKAIEDIGVAYQLVTDETSMVVLSDAVFSQYGIERRNKARTDVEHQAQSVRSQSPVRANRVDAQSPMFPHAAHGLGGGGGAIDPVSASILFGLIGIGLLPRKNRAKPRTSNN